MFFQSLRHNPNGRFVVVCGDGEYIIYTALAWRNRSFGSALEIVWSTEGEYAVRESTSKIKIYSKNFQVCSLCDMIYELLFSFFFMLVNFHPYSKFRTLKPRFRYSNNVPMFLALCLGIIEPYILPFLLYLKGLDTIDCDAMCYMFEEKQFGCCCFL